MPRFGLPKGAVRTKAYNIIHGEKFVEEAYIGLVNTGKTYAMVDFLIRRCNDYPGMACILGRDYKNMLKDTFIPILEARGGMYFETQNRNEVRYTWKDATCPRTGDKVNSRIDGWGLALLPDVDEVFRGQVYGTSVLNEGNLFSTDIHDGILGRLRQDVFHISKTVYDLALANAMVWGVRPEEAYEIMYADFRHTVGRLELEIDSPQPAPMIQKTDFNPRYQEPAWERYVASPYKIPYPDPAWVRDNVGVREVYTDGLEIIKDDKEPIAGTEFRVKGLPIERRFHVEFYDKKSKTVKLINVAQPEPLENLILVSKRNAYYAFTSENESRNYDNDMNMYLFQNQTYRKSITRAESSKDVGMRFPNFTEDYLHNKGHLVEVTNSMLAEARIGIGGLDKGGNHPHAVINSFYLPRIQGILIYDEMYKSGISNIDAAHYAKEMILPNFQEQYWGYDPSMDYKRFDTDVEYKPIDSYYEALGEKNLFAGIKGDQGFDLVNNMLMFLMRSHGIGHMPRILVSDKCEGVIECFTKLTKYMVKNQRDNPLVDIGDSLKLLVSIVDMVAGYMIMNAQSFEITTNKVYDRSRMSSNSAY